MYSLVNSEMSVGARVHNLLSSTKDLLTFMFTAPLVEADSEVEEDYYLLWRMEQGVPEGSTEIPKGWLHFQNDSARKTCVSLLSQMVVLKFLSSIITMTFLLYAWSVGEYYFIMHNPKISVLRSISNVS